MLGNTLRAAREARELTLREVEWATRIKADYLAALEAEDFDRLPGAVYARGFLRSYAGYLAVDAEPLISEYNQLHAGATQIVSTRPAVRTVRDGWSVTPRVLGAVALLVIAGVFAFYVKHQLDRYGATRQSADAAPRTASLGVASPLPSLSPVPSPSPSPSPLGLVVAVKVDAPVWLRVEVDGKPSDLTGGAAGKVVAAGTVLTFDGTHTVHVRSGKAAHTFIALNGKDLGPMAAGDAAGVGDKTYQKGQPA
jgi:cytoskeleton protein RodZ